MQQIPVRVVYLHKVKPSLDRAPRRRREPLAHLIDIPLRHLPRHANILIIRHRARALHLLRPPAVLDRRLRRKRQERRHRAGLAPRVRELDPELLVLRVREVDDALPRRDVRVFPQPRAVRRDAPLRQDAGGFGERDAWPPRDDAAEVRGVPFGDEAVARGVLAEGRQHDAVLHAHAADLEWLEEFGDGLVVGLRGGGCAGGDGLPGREVFDLEWWWWLVWGCLGGWGEWVLLTPGAATLTSSVLVMANECVKQAIDDCRCWG